MKKIHFSILTMSISIFFVGCQSYLSNSYDRRKPCKHELVTKAGYYLIDDDSNSVCTDFPYLIFYEDGTYFWGGDFSYRNKAPKPWLSDTNNFATQCCWGSYKIVGNTIRLRNVKLKIKATYLEQTLIDPIVIGGMNSTYTGSQVYDTCFIRYYFHPLSQKPDSTNVLMKK